MSMLKIQLLAASAVVGIFSAGAAQAQYAYATAEIRGNGASSIVNVLNQAQNCWGGTDNQIGLNNNTFAPATTPFVYTALRGYDCAVKSVQPNLQGKYVSTGSGTGRSNWKNFTGAVGGTGNPFGTWTNIQYAFSATALVQSDLDSYNTKRAALAAATTPNQIGAPIQIPVYILPIALAYKSSYGKILTAGGVVELKLNLKYARANGSGGLRLTKAAYCGIIAGTISNFNDAALKTLNGNQSLMDANDDLARWNATGVLIKLVGHADNSGTTNVFTRHVGAVCGNANITSGTDPLPAAIKSTAVYDKTTGAMTSGTEAVGKFGVADGSDGVSHAINAPIADPTTLGEVTLGGRLGYIGAGWVLPQTANASDLHSADLQIGNAPVTNATKYAAPTAANATLAFGTTLLPPQSDTKGNYLATAVGDRANPLDWTQSPASTNSLANPVTGYPIVGTTNAFLYTCYANDDVRKAVVHFFTMMNGKIIRDSEFRVLPRKLVVDIASTQLGINAASGIAPMPNSWKKAIIDTFLKKATGTTGTPLGARNLWIQDKLPTATTAAKVVRNPGCVAGQGA